MSPFNDIMNSLFGNNDSDEDEFDHAACGRSRGAATAQSGSIVKWNSFKPTFGIEGPMSYDPSCSHSAPRASNESSLIAACRRGNLKELRELLNNDTNINMEDEVWHACFHKGSMVMKY